MFVLGESAQGEALLRITGVFDAVGAKAAREMLDAARLPLVILDFSQAVEVDHHGLQVLVDSLMRTNCEVRIRGIDTHHVRVMRYLGLDPARLGIEPAIL